MGVLWAIPVMCVMVPFAIPLMRWPIGARIRDKKLILRYLVLPEARIPLNEISLCCPSRMSLPAPYVNRYDVLILFNKNGKAEILSESLIKDVVRIPLHRYNIPYGKSISRFIPGFKWRFKPKP